jgi:type 1 glutamine amidotransferase
MYRSFGIINMKRHGLDAIVCGDLVQAITANGCDAATKESDPNFTPAKGSARVLRYLEQKVAPSIESRQLIAAAGMDPHADDKRPHVVFVIAEKEYGTDRTLPEFARKYLDKDFRCTFVYAKAGEGPGRDDVPGLEVLYDADMLVLSMRRRMLPVVQMDHLEWFIRSGKPLVGLRVSIVPFQVRPDNRPPGRVIWRDFDQEVLGCHYRGYPAESRGIGCDVWVVDAARDHPIVRGIDPKGFHSTSWPYNLSPLTETTTLLIQGRWADDQPVQPVAFTNTFNGARVFYTSLGHAGDFQLDSFNRLLRNGIYWVMDMPGG